ncbi:MAG: ATP-binding cassette domain-containing protein [Polyangiaceae bacterium]|nr:ATP-binding cassette domain-containing protein [Polyangiaceae bacterium]
MLLGTVALPPIVAEQLQKTFRQGFFMKRVEAVKGVSFTVEAGSIFGFLGPNGAGKTTTIKMLTGLIAPTGGRATVFGEPIPSLRAQARTGFLPENPYVYPYLTPAEFVEMCARISGIRGRAVRSRTREVLERVGMLYAADRPVRKLSKGMLQRTGIAAALVSEPELLILDEPMSGLDPVGRKEVRDLILDERRRGRTIFFSTHILSDVETLCDRVAILRKGEVVVSGTLSELLRRDLQRTDIVLAGADQRFVKRIKKISLGVERIAERVVVAVGKQVEINAILRAALDAGVDVVEVVHRSETLEDLFVREAIDEHSSASPAKVAADAAHGSPAAPDEELLALPEPRSDPDTALDLRPPPLSGSDAAPNSDPDTALDLKLPPGMDENPDPEARGGPDPEARGGPDPEVRCEPDPEVRCEPDTDPDPK